MQVAIGINSKKPQSKDSIVTLGAFDGIHRGHMELLDRVTTIARDRNGSSVLLTFEPHPQRVIAPGTAPPLLTTREEKLALLEGTGLDTVVILPFNRELSQMEAQDFVREVLVGALGARFVVLGHDHAFGKGRGGRPELLREMAPDLGFGLEVVEAVSDEGEPITSTLIRQLLEEGKVKRAGRLLGRPYSVQGLVVKGDKRGKKLGFPTANLAIPIREKCIPGDGVYTVRSTLEGRVFAGACSIGTRPTFGANQRIIEVHIIDFDNDIYGESIEVIFHSRLRDEMVFESSSALIHQIEKDMFETERILRQEKTECL